MVSDSLIRIEWEGRHLAAPSGSFHWNLKDSIGLLEKTEKKNSRSRKINEGM